MADHNDPNAVNTIFSDIEPIGADLYDVFGFRCRVRPAKRPWSWR
jgi:hypothetical protein